MLLLIYVLNTYIVLCFRIEMDEGRGTLASYASWSNFCSVGSPGVAPRDAAEPDIVALKLIDGRAAGTNGGSDSPLSVTNSSSGSGLEHASPTSSARAPRRRPTRRPAGGPRDHGVQDAGLAVEAPHPLWARGW